MGGLEPRDSWSWGPHVLALAQICFFATIGNAYDPESGHKRLSRIALERFNICEQRDPTLTVNARRLPFSPADIERIVAADVQEDDPRPRRLLNWHFHAPKDLARAIGIDRSLNRIYLSISRKIASSATQEDAVPFLGRAMHYLEDMTVPAHVVPVFHVGALSDAIDEHPVRDPFPPFASCEDLRAANREFSSLLSAKTEKANGRIAALRVLLDRTAGQTIRRIEDPLCRSESPGLTWQRFWRPPGQLREFGRYAEDIQKFGVTQTIFAPGNRRCELELRHYDAFALAGHRAAIRSDILLLFLVRDWLLSTRSSSTPPE